jgi:signal transduction histidine kinase
VSSTTIFKTAISRPGRRKPERKERPFLLRSASIRFAVIYAGLLAISTAMLAMFLWWATAGLLNRQVDAAIRADARGLMERWEEGGIPSLVLTINDRLAENLDDDAIYLLVNPELQPLAGNLAHWPAVVQRTDGFYELPVQRAGVPSIARVKRLDLPGNYYLLVGRDVRNRAQLRRLLTDALLWAMLVVVLMASAGALVVRNLFRRTLANVSETATAIAAGDLSRRVRLSGRGDEFDQLAETINDMLDRIARLMEGVRQVSNAIAHDLRTPITRARARLEEAANHAHTAEDLRAAIERATDDLDGIVAVFQALLRIAEIEAGSRRSSFAMFDLRPVLDGIEELYSVVAEEKQVQLIVTAPPSLPVFGDQALVQQAIANLVDNAVKFSPPSGIVSITASPLETGASVSVADQGPGIPAADRARAVERFYRGEQARSTPGSGLGLSLVQAVAQLHGGWLRLEDADPGLRATLFLPRGDDTPAG